MLKIIYDGWSLIYNSNSPASLHLLTLFDLLPDHIDPIVALPAAPPPWFPRIPTQVRQTPNSPYNRLIWEQRFLPGLVAEMDTHLLHLTSPSPPLFGKPVTVISPAGFYPFTTTNSGRTGKRAREKSPDLSAPGSGSLAARLRKSLAQGGFARLRGIIWPDDLPPPTTTAPILQIPPAVHSTFAAIHWEDFQPPTELDLPETYVLYHGPDDFHSLHQLLDAWSWATASIGDRYPLVILGLTGTGRELLETLLANTDFRETVLPLPQVPPLMIPEVYQGSAALVHPAQPSPWGDPIRHAMACGIPVVATESQLTDAVVGPAAYLVPAEEARTTGAAIITVLLEDEVADRLTAAARKRANAWRSTDFSQSLLNAYQSLVG
jgi:glycosyltransferase involved in cell wall biosynthesis